MSPGSVASKMRLVLVTMPSPTSVTAIPASSSATVGALRMRQIEAPEDLIAVSSRRDCRSVTPITVPTSTTSGSAFISQLAAPAAMPSSASGTPPTLTR